MKKWLAALAVVALSTQAQAGKILLTEFDFAVNGGVNVYQQMAAKLTAAGHTVTIVNAKVAGNVAAALSADSYDQVYLWDLTSTGYLGGSDLTALASFWQANKGLVVDTRSYGYYFQGANASEVALLGNVASQLDKAGGGVWVGTDHDSQWTRNGNPFLAAIGVSEVTGSFGNAVNYADPSSVLLAGVTPTELWAAGQTVGRAPIGVQANGITMYIHFGHQNGDTILPYISASFPLRGVDPNPNPTPAPASVGLLGLGLVAMGWMRRRRPTA